MSKLMVKFTLLGEKFTLLGQIKRYMYDHLACIVNTRKWKSLLNIFFVLQNAKNALFMAQNVVNNRPVTNFKITFYVKPIFDATSLLL